jgi:hypothetical protein
MHFRMDLNKINKIQFNFKLNITNEKHNKSKYSAILWIEIQIRQFYIKWVFINVKK